MTKYQQVSILHKIYVYRVSLPSVDNLSWHFVPTFTPFELIFLEK